MTEVTTHEHEFDGPPKRGHVHMCVDRKCTALRIGTGHRWRELTPREQTEVTIKMMEDIVIAQTGVIIHGQERGMAWARRVLGYDR